MPSSVTQINYLTISNDTRIENPDSETGRLWEEALSLLEKQNGFQRMYWGRSPEDWSKVQLHVGKCFYNTDEPCRETDLSVRNHLSQHYDFQNTPEYDRFQSILNRLIVPSTKPFTRHAYLEDFTPSSQALGKGAPFSGTAVYLSTDEAWHVGSWPLWTHIVRHVDGCLGVSGGRVVESVEGHHNCYVVYVGWESIEKHDAYHHTKHFANRRVVLALGNKGWTEYGHVTFSAAREGQADVQQTAQTSRSSRL